MKQVILKLILLIMNHGPLVKRFVLIHKCPSEDVCRLALLRRYRFISHIYTLFYMAHQRGTPIVAPNFFADSKDPRLRFVENCFLLGPLLVCARYC
ncbi:hypothetical protein Taro_024113, partial [Colocasia esculenta]|nr:hypothetical protein [Colocasia esculenta]